MSVERKPRVFGFTGEKTLLRPLIKALVAVEPRSEAPETVMATCRAGGDFVVVGPVAKNAFMVASVHLRVLAHVGEERPGRKCSLTRSPT